MRTCRYGAEIATVPGAKIFPGELAKGLSILADGGDIDHVGASAVELIGSGESSGSHRQVAVQDGAPGAVRFR